MFFVVIGLTTAVLTLLAYVIGIFEALWAIPLVYIVIGLVLIILWAISCFICSRFINMDKECDKHNSIFRYYTNRIIEIVMWFYGIKLHVTGLEILPKEKFLLVCNHRGAMDPLITMGVLRKYHMGFVAKKELFKIPVIARLMHSSFCLSLDRDDVKESAKTILRAGQIIKEGKASMGIYPEGKRNRGDGLLPFMNGAFKVAIKAQCPIVVATIKNTEHIMKKMSFKKRHVYLDFIGIIDKEFVIEHNTSEISDVAREMMEEKMRKNKECNEK